MRACPVCIIDWQKPASDRYTVCSFDQIELLSDRVGTDPRCDCFLADVGVTGPVNQPPLVAARKLFLSLSDELHRPVDLTELLFAEVRCLRGHV
jgi:hypothetical protein